MARRKALFAITDLKAAPIASMVDLSAFSDEQSRRIERLASVHLSQRLTAEIRERVSRGHFGRGNADSRLFAVPYSTGPVFMPITRKASQEPVARARSEYASLMLRASAAFDGSRRRSGVFADEGEGYLAIRKAAGLPTRPNLAFTGQMMRDFRARVRVRRDRSRRPEKRGLLEEHVRLVARNKRNAANDLGGTASAFRVRHQAGMQKVDNLMEVTYWADVEMGFATRRSHAIYMFHHKGLGSNPRRRFAFLTRAERRLVGRWMREGLERFAEGASSHGAARTMDRLLPGDATGLKLYSVPF